MSERCRHRASVLLSLGAAPTDLEPVLSYTERGFDCSRLSLPLVLPPAAEAHIESWRGYAERGGGENLFEVLRENLVQLHFPVQAGISRSETYLRATRTGVVPTPPEGGLQLQQPRELQLVIHPTAAGPIPVLIVAGRCDFVALVQALTKKNEPVAIPDAMGACIVTGYNNWGRVAEWKSSVAADSSDWAARFAEFRTQKALYQDRFILLSRGPYSNVSASALGLDCDETRWLETSLLIRLEHECTHYLTYRLLGSMRNHLFDELLSDYAGIVAGYGRYRADWFLHFLGLESLPDYRVDGRFEYYVAQASLTLEAQVVLRALVERGAWNLEQLDRLYRTSIEGSWPVAHMIAALSFMNLEELASAQHQSLFEQKLTLLKENIKTTNIS